MKYQLCPRQLWRKTPCTAGMACIRSARTEYNRNPSVFKDNSALHLQDKMSASVSEEYMWREAVKHVFSYSFPLKCIIDAKCFRENRKEK